MNDSAAKDALAGLAAGLAASWVMSKVMKSGVESMKERLGDQETKRRMIASPEGRSPTAKTAAVVAERVAGAALSEEQLEKADPIVHYAFGAFLGVLYALVGRRMRVAKLGRGLAYGTAVWLGADVVALPAFNLSKPPTEYPASTHGFGLLAHLVYGLSLDGVARFIRRML